MLKPALSRLSNGRNGPRRRLACGACGKPQLAAAHDQTGGQTTQIARAHFYSPPLQALRDQDADAEAWVRQFRDGAGFADLMRAVKEKLAQSLAGDAPRGFFLYIDQAEELYASTERKGKPDSAAKRDAEDFSRVIAEAAGRPECRVLFSLRSDYYGRLQADEALFAVSRRVDVPPMPVDALRQAIERPAAALGVRFEPAAMPSDIAGATAREAGALPLLAYLLSDMWREMQGRSDGVMRSGERP